MSVWPFIPTDEFVEALEWKSDVLRPYSAEQRIRLTQTPRQRFTFDHRLQHRAYQRAKALLTGGMASAWTVPMWHEKQSLTVSAGATTINVTTTASDYRVGGEAVLWTDDENYEAVTISSVGGSSIGTSAVVGNYTDALIMPGASCRIVGGVETSRTVEPMAVMSIEFLSYETANLANAGLYSTSYRSYPVIDDPAVLGSGSFAERMEWPEDVCDNGIAEAFHDTQRSTPLATFVAAWLTTTAADRWALRRFLHSRYGRSQAFWIPDWMSGITVTANITSAGTTITILSVGLNTNMETGDLMVQTNAGAQHLFRYTAVAPSGSNEVLTLSAAAGVNISTTDIRRACLLHHCRFAQDRIELIHTAAGHCSVMVACEEVPYA